ncbi:MAG: hypothetical protein ACRENF_04380, partial [Thermodesulfobacteriota bacterium]
LGSALDEAQRIMRDARGAISTVADKARPSIIAIGETVDKAHYIVSKTGDAIATTSANIQGQLIEPLRQASCMAVAVDRALRHLLRSS